MTLEEKLIKEGRTKWLDIGCGKILKPGFIGIDYYTHEDLNEDDIKRFYQMNILDLEEGFLTKIGSFDFVRMQHVFEHFTFEEGKIVLRNCSKLLKKDGLLLITVPDLQLFIKYYKKRSFNKIESFYNWAITRVPENSPISFFFSVYAYSMIHEQHRWCYDYDGLRYQIESTGLYKNIRKIKLNNKLSSVPFTHNRPKEDLCVLAEIK